MLNLTEQQSMIRESARRFLDEQLPFSKRQAIATSDSGYDTEQWSSFAELGWLGIAIPEQYGGFDGSIVDAALIYQQMGRTLTRSPYLNCMEAVFGILQVGNEQQKLHYIEKVSSGESIITCGFYESEDPADRPQTEVSQKGNAWMLNGCKSLVPWGNQSDYVLISVMLEGQLNLVIIDTNNSGIRIRPYRMYDDSRAADMEFSDVVIKDENILGPLSQDLLLKIMDVHSAMNCMEASEMMWAVHNQTLEFMKNREQFGQTLSSMQALQHRIVDVYINCQLAQSMAEDAIVAATDTLYSDSHARRISAAKAFIGENSRLVGKEGIQLHGGIGMTTDIPIGHYFKRFSVIDQSNGNAAWHRERFRILSHAQ
jgi:alkylation response protein AidB-like acyl-CoA dehydrogenase